MILNYEFHLPVLLPQVIDGLKIKAGNKYIDATLGGGGYTEEILRRGGMVLGIDCDRDALEYVKGKWKIGKEVFLEHGNFADLKKIAEKYGFNDVAGIIFDLGMSTYQLEKAGKGFTFQRDEPLDMRMDETLVLTAADVINTYSVERLYEIFSRFAEELNSRPIAEAIFRARTINGSIRTTGQLVEIISKVVGNDKYRLRIIARIFQALRIVVNEEITKLREGLLQACDLLKVGGRLTVLSYHSLEDRVVKFTLNQERKTGNLQIITSKPIRADLDEVKVNQKAKSAKLRIAEKIYEQR